MKTTRYYLTTPIYYVNDVPHVGHAYTTIAADALTRARKLQGHDAFLLEEPELHATLRGFLDGAAEHRGLPRR